MKSNGEECTFTIVSGRAKGADTNGEKYANTHGYKLDLFPANWAKYGNMAGFLRNTEMAKHASPENAENPKDIEGMLIAFWDGVSKGTAHMISEAERYGLETHVINY